MKINNIMHNVQTKNRFGEYVTAIPEPYYAGFIKICFCGHIFITKRHYQGHYSLEHILYYK